MVEVSGMLVSASAAQRRRFLSQWIQRAAKASARRGGGTLTLLFGLRGVPALGQRAVPALSPQSLAHASPELRAKLDAALERKAAAAATAAAASSDSSDNGTFLAFDAGHAQRQSAVLRMVAPGSNSLLTYPS
jgi:hypothetical protein